MGKGNGNGEGWGEGEGKGMGQGNWKSGLCSSCEFTPKCKHLIFNHKNYKILQKFEIVVIFSNSLAVSILLRFHRLLLPTYRNLFHRGKNWRR